MSLFDRNLNIFKTLKPTYTRKRIGYLGRYNTDGSIDPDPRADLPADTVWVRFDGERGATRVKNLRVRAEWGTPVWVEFNELTREDEVREVHSLLAPQTFGGAVAAALNAPALPASVPTPTTARDLLPGGVFADAGGGLTVRVLPMWLPGGGWWDGSTLITLTPTSTVNRKALAVIGIHPLTRAVTTALTTDRGLAVALISDGLPTAAGAADLHAVTAAYPAVYWVGAVELAHGATSIDPARIIDLRLWSLSTMTGATASAAGQAGLVPAPDAGDETRFLRGDATWQPVSVSGADAVLTGAGAVTIPRYATHPDAVPVAPNAADDEFAGSTLDGAWAWVNQGSAAATVSKSRLLLNVPSTSSSNVRGVFRTYPGAPCTWEAAIRGWSSLPLWSGANNYSVGLARRDSATGRIEMYSIAWQSASNALLLLCDRWTSATVFSSTVASAQIGRVTFASLYLQLVDDGTNLTYKWSLDGVYWTPLTSFARAAFLANANQIGLAVFTQQNGGTIYLQSDWLRRTA